MSSGENPTYNDKETRELKVAQVELKSLKKPDRVVYEKRGGLFFLSSKEKAMANVTRELDRRAQS